MSYRAMLLASAAGLVWCSAAHATDYNNTSPVSGTSTLFGLGSGDTLTNSSSAVITSGAQPAVRVSPVSAGTITNSGTIASFGSPGTAISVGGTLTRLTNSGTIAADADNGTAIDIQAGGSIGALINQASGIISANGANGVAINVIGNVGSLGNSGLISANGTGGIAVNLGSLGSIGTLSNAGTIQATGSNGVAVLVGGQLGTLSNSGMIQGSTVTSGSGGGAVFVTDTGRLATLSNNAGGTIASSSYSALDVLGQVGTVTNRGFIGATGGSSNDGVFVENGGSIGSFANLAGGTIQANTADGWGLEVEAGGTIGTLANNGLIQATGSPGHGIHVSGGIGLLSNSGTVSGNSYGIIVVGSIANGISNVAGGLIQSTGSGGTGIYVTSGGGIGLLANAGTIAGNSTGILLNGTIPGGIANLTGGLIQGGPSDGSGVAIDNSGGHPLTINNAGRVIGAIELSGAGDRLNVTGGSITGAITSSGTTDSLVYSLGNGGSFSTGGSISGVGTVDVASGSVNFLNSVAAAQAFNVASGATAMLNPGAPVGAVSFVNAGAVSVGGSAASITGNYTQTSSGTLKVTVTNATIGGMQVGSLGVSGNALIQGTTNAVSASVPYNVTISSLINRSGTVLSAGTLTASNPSALTASTDNVALAFNLAQVNNSLVLTAVLPTDFNQARLIAEAEIDRWYAQTDAVYPPTGNDIQARHFLANVLAGLSLAGYGDLVQHISNVLDPPSPLTLAQFERQLQPNPLFSGAVNVAMSAGTFGTGASQIQQREQMTLLQDTGLSAGDTVGRGIAAWVQPFGSFLTQDAKNGADGYSLNTYGATLGGDTRVTPQLRLGLAVTLANQDLRMNGLSSGEKGSTFTAQFGLYGIWHWNDFFVDGLLSYGHNSYSSTTPIPLFGLTKKADYGGNQFGAKVGVGYNYTLPNRIVITPYASLEQMHLGFSSYTTTGAFPFNAHVNGQSVDLTQTSLGARVSYPVKLSMGTLRPEVHANWFHTFGNTNVTTTYSTADVATPGVFSYTGPSLDHDMFNVGVSATLFQGGPWSFSGGYDFNGRSSSTEHVVYLRASYKF